MKDFPRQKTIIHPGDETVDDSHLLSFYISFFSGINTERYESNKRRKRQQYNPFFINWNWFICACQFLNNKRATQNKKLNILNKDAKYSWQKSIDRSLANARDHIGSNHVGLVVVTDFHKNHCSGMWTHNSLCHAKNWKPRFKASVLKTRKFFRAFFQAKFIWFNASKYLIWYQTKIIQIQPVYTYFL